MVVAVVHRLYQQRQCIRLQLPAHVRQTLAERTACVYAAFAHERRLPGLLVSVVHTETLLVCALYLLENLAEDRVLALMVYFSLVNEALGFATTDLYLALAPLRKVIDCVLDKLIFHAEEYHILDSLEGLGHITATGALI